jgi:hypothetical protein
MNQFYPLWSIWREISLLYRFFIFVLCGVGLYTTYSAVSILLRLRAIKAQALGIDAMRELPLLERRSTNMRQVLTAAFYFFGCIFFLNLPGAYQSLGHRSASPVFEIFQNFVLNFSFAANIFFIFFVLHTIQWLVWRRLNSFQKRLSQP